MKREGFEDVVRPQGELLPILAGRAEQRADDRDGVGAREVGDDVAAARVGDPIDQLVHHLDHGVVQAQGRSGCECLGRQAAQPMVRVPLQAQQAVDHLVPQRTRRDALGEEVQAGRDLESGVPQHRTDQVVGEHFGSERSQRDRGLPLRRPEAGIDLCGSFLGVVGERRQVGVENACGSCTDGHDGLLRIELLRWPTDRKLGMGTVRLSGSDSTGHLPA